MSMSLNLSRLVTALTNRIQQKRELLSPGHNHPCSFLLVLLGTFALGTLSFHVKRPATLRYVARPHVGWQGHM